MSGAFPFRRFNSPYLNTGSVPHQRRPSLTLPSFNQTNTPGDSRRLPCILTMRLSEWIDSLTHPVTGAFPFGISPKEMDQLARSQVASSSLEHGIEFRPLWKTCNHLGVLLWNEVKAGRIHRLHKACYVGRTHQAMQQDQIGHKLTGPETMQLENQTESSHQHPSLGSFRDSGTSEQVGEVVSQESRQVRQARPTQKLGEERSTEMENALNRVGIRCSICNKSDNNVDNVVLKCKGCSYQSHLKCSYPSGLVPASLLNRSLLALSNWRCYDCKCCHLCSKNDDLKDDLLLCDGCDSGEHMGCQNPPLQEVPPAPWYCSICRGLRANGKSCNGDETRSANPCPTATSEINEALSQADERSKSSASSSSKSHTANSRSNCSDRICSFEPSTQSAWVTILNTDTPPMSDEAGDSPTGQRTEQKTPIQAEASTQKSKPIKIRIGKRPYTKTQERSKGSETDCDWQDPKRPNTRSASAVLGRVAGKSSMHVHRPLGTNNAASRETGVCLQEDSESSLSPVIASGHYALGEEDKAEIHKVKLWSVDNTSTFLERHGFTDSAAVFKREEIDGPALLLLQRQDVLQNLGVKLGPALKTYRLVRLIQSTVRSM